MLSWRKHQAGDTIVEVLVAMAVISLVLVGAFVTTNHNVLATQDTQEHSEALQIAQGQVEFLRGTPLASGDNCYYNGMGASSTGQVPGHDPCVVTGNGQMAGAVVQPAYKIMITPPVSPSTTYQVVVSWTSLVSSNNNNVMLFYQQ